MSTEKTISTYSLRWPNRLRDQYRQLALQHGMTVSAYLMMVLNEHAAKRAKESKK